MIRLLILLFPVLLFASDYIQIGDYKIYPYSPEGDKQWPTGYIHVVVDSSSIELRVDSLGSGVTHQSFKSQILNRIINNIIDYIDSSVVYVDSINFPSWAIPDPGGTGFYSSKQYIMGHQGDFIRTLVEAYKATKETKYLNKAIFLWKQITDSSYVKIPHRDGIDSVLVQNKRPQNSISAGPENGATQYNIDIALYEIYERIGKQSYYDHFKDLYDLTMTWIDTIDVDTFKISSWYIYGGADDRVNYHAYPNGFLMWATAKGFGDHTMSGDSLLWRLDNYFRAHIDSTAQLRYTYETSHTGITWGYTGMELNYHMDGALALRSAGITEPYLGDWDYTIQGMQDDAYANPSKKGSAVCESWPSGYLMAKDLNFTVDDSKFPNQIPRVILTHIYTPMFGHNHSTLGINWTYAERFYAWSLYYNIKYLKNYSNPFNAFPALTDSIKTTNYTWDYFKFYNNSNVYRFPTIAGLKFNLSSFDSLTYETVNDSSILEVAYYHGDTTCTIRRVSSGYFTEIKNSHPTELIIMNQVTGIYDATAKFFKDTLDTTLWMADMPAGKDTTITFSDSTIIFIFDDDEYMTIKANGTDWIFNKDNETVTSDFGVTKAKITAATETAIYDILTNRNYFLNNQFQILDYVYPKSLGKLILQMY